MRFAKVRLAVAALLFVGWIGYLAYLALNFSHPVIVSRSQYMAADFPVLAEVNIDADGRPKAEVAALEDLRVGVGPKGFELPKAISVSNLPDMKYPGERPARTGRHLLLLTRGADGTFKITATPPSPGDRGGRAYIYPWNSEVESQVKKWRE